jgi:LCP family protein required for cell wall assembly
VLLLVALLLLGLFGVAVAAYASSQIDRMPVGGLRPADAGPLHVLVVGSDSREGLTPEQQAELGTGFVGGDRPDTIFVMSVQGGRAALLAFPRDLWVTRCDGSNGRINGAVAVGGHDCLVETVSSLSGLPIHNYLVVNFLGFRDIVDAVGGVELCLDAPIRDASAAIDLPAGCQRLNGVQALGFVRVRKIDNDLERIRRQQQFLQALAGEVASPATLLNPVRLLTTAGSTGAALTADEGLGMLGLGRIGLGLRGMASGAAATYTVPVTPANIGGAAVLQPVTGEAEALFARFRDGSVLGRTAAPPR